MIWLSAIPALLMIAAACYRPKTRAVLLTPQLSPSERIARWQAMYGRLTLEQQLDPGAWPFVASAVHSLPRREQTDPRELLQ